MTQDNKIWHNFGECAKPNSFVLKRHNIDGSFELVKTSDSGFMQIGELLRGKWCYIDDLIASSKALEKLDAEYNEFICNTWVDYADEPDENLASDARMLRDRMRKVMSSQILKERDNYKKALDVAIDALKEIIPEHEGFLDNEMYACSGIASRALIKIKEIMKGGE